MAFNIEQLFEFAVAELEKFAAEHQEETFYGFAIDASFLCLNSEEAAKKTLEEYPQSSPAGILALRENTGDWAYQGFATMTEDDGFDEDAYEEHYDLDEAEQVSSVYGVAMDALLARLVESKAFDGLRLSPCFKANRVEHSY